MGWEERFQIEDLTANKEIKTTHQVGPASVEKYEMFKRASKHANWPQSTKMIGEPEEWTILLAAINMSSH